MPHRLGRLVSNRCLLAGLAASVARRHAKARLNADWSRMVRLRRGGGRKWKINRSFGGQTIQRHRFGADDGPRQVTIFSGCSDVGRGCSDVPTTLRWSVVRLGSLGGPERIVESPTGFNQANIGIGIGQARSCRDSATRRKLNPPTSMFVVQAGRSAARSAAQAKHQQNTTKNPTITMNQPGQISNLRRGGLLDPESFDWRELFREVQRKFSDKRKNRNESEVETPEETEPDVPDVDYRSQVLQIVRTISPAGFERLCQRLLRESGFETVTVTGRSGDGGIDGTGTLQINPFVSFNVLFQCKRYVGSVSPSQVRDFRGAMQGRADKGLILTTGTFTVEAKREARRDGAPPIELVDGDELIRLFESLEFGLTARTTYDVDEEFFSQYAE